MDHNTFEIDDLLRLLVDRGASDLHLKPMRPPLLRANGKLQPVETDPLPPEAIRRMLDRLLTDRLRSILDERLAVDFGHSVRGLSRFRASVYYQRGTLSAVFRRVPFDFPTLEDWGLPPVLDRLVRLQQGLVLITGPTGTGKSSTLAAMMRLIADTRQVHLLTIEDPIEFLLTDSEATVTQREIGTDTPSFEIALRNALRQDPDVIMVGEMRDPTTIQTVLTAAETGHLVFSTLHTNGAAQTIDRIIDSFPQGNHRQIRQQLASVLQAIVSMKLVERKDGGGLVAAIEILRRTPQVCKLISEGKLEALQEEIEDSVVYHKMQSMNQSLAALVLHGVLEKQTALAHSVNPGDLDLLLRSFIARPGSHDPSEEDGMAEPLSDYSKIVELQEIKRLHEEQQERTESQLAERDRVISQLREQLEQQAGPTAEVGDDTELEEFRRENERLNQQLQRVRDEYESKISRLNQRVREISARGAPEPVAPERKGFFKR